MRKACHFCWSAARLRKRFRSASDSHPVCRSVSSREKLSSRISVSTAERMRFRRYAVYAARCSSGRSCDSQKPESAARRRCCSDVVVLKLLQSSILSTPLLAAFSHLHSILRYRVSDIRRSPTENKFSFGSLALIISSFLSIDNVGSCYFFHTFTIFL